MTYRGTAVFDWHILFPITQIRQKPGLRDTSVASMQELTHQHMLRINVSNAFEKSRYAAMVLCMLAVRRWQNIIKKTIIIIIIQQDWQCKAGRWRLTPYQFEDPSPTLPTYRGKEEKGKIVEDKKGESN